MIRAAPANDRLDADVCVIGSGAAGVALARDLAGGPLRVVVLESGGARALPDPDPLYGLEAAALPVPTHSRVRAFGGTTTVWSGRWKRYDPIDFVERDWVPRSGWPITYDALVPYYERAARAAQVTDDGDAPAVLQSDIVVPTVFKTLAAANRDFGQAASALLAGAPNVDVLLGAHVVGYERAGRRIVRVHTDKDLAVAARFVVIATGGIENARQLLLAKLGNEHDQVGRYYMDHPKARVGVVETYEPLAMSAWAGLDESAPVWVGFRLADAVQRAERTLNSYVFLAPAFERDLPHRLARRLVPPRVCRVLDVRNYMEQLPVPENRVELSRDAVDPLGQPRARLHWTIGERDRETMIAMHRLLAGELRRARIGELASPLLGGEFPAFQDASHHMGTTRMGADPRTSVVDASCRVHAIDNLFVAGSSVFPTSGYANPTATIAALAIRLADHLKARA
jgi:choline dehydrogenase-like flavoprotein